MSENGGTMALPKLSPASLLAHIFAPKRNPKPSGIKAVKLKGLQGGRKAGRLAAFNRMSPVKQAMLKQSGQREEYLRGNKTLADIKATVRATAVDLGVARPLRPRPNPAPPRDTRKVSPLWAEEYKRSTIAQLIIDRFNATNVAHNPKAIRNRVGRMNDDQLRKATKLALAVDGAMGIKALARKRYEDDPSLYLPGAEYNAFWYN